MNNQPTGRFSSLLQRFQAAQARGQAAVATVQEGAYLGKDDLKKLEDFARVDLQTRKDLADLARARKDVENNAFANRESLRNELQALARMENPDADEVRELLFAATAQKLRNGAMALPLFVEIKLNELRGHPTALVYPSAWHNGAIVVRGVRAIVPATPEDEECLKIVRVARRKAAKALVEKLEGETLVNLRDAIWAALYVFDHASVWSPAEAEKVFENGEADLLVRRKDGKKFSYFLLSEKEAFVAEQSELADRLVRQLGELNGFAKRYWAGEVDVDAMIEEAVTTSRETLVSVEDFLKGLPGIVAVRHAAWKPRRDRDETVPVSILLDRPVGRTEWRWLMCNSEAVKALFGGQRLSFHNWNEVPFTWKAKDRDGNVLKDKDGKEIEKQTDSGLPPFIESLLMKGEPIAPVAAA